MRAHARCFRIGDRLRHLRKRSHCHWCNEAESDSLALGSRLRSSQSGRPRARQAYPPDRSVSRCRLPFSAGPELHVERAIHMADTSQSARRIRVYPGVTGGTEHTETHGGNRLIFSVWQAMPEPGHRGAPWLRASVAIFFSVNQAAIPAGWAQVTEPAKWNNQSTKWTRQLEKPATRRG